MKVESECEPKFIADEMLGRLARWLRAVGYDTLYYTGGGDSELVQRALRQNRIILTRDSYLVKRKLARRSILVRSDKVGEQLKQVVEAAGLDVQSRAFTRCLVCNAVLKPVAKPQVRDRVPTYTYLTHNKFYECPGCHKIYWRGSHRDKMWELIDAMVD